VRFDRKLLLIAPTIVLAFVVAGMLYAASQLQVLSNAGAQWKDRSDFVNAVARGEKPLSVRQAVGMLQWSLDTESKRTAAIAASHDLLIELAIFAALACVVLAIGIRSVPREHWPRFTRGKQE
jgi:hypothetical protein